MSQQSDLGRLYRKRAWGSQSPIENYTSEALAIAIEHDDGPMRAALASIRWPGSRPFEPHDVVRIRPETQHFLPAVDLARDGEIRRVRDGYLDLVLTLTLANGASSTAWVEVKVDTGEHGDQLDVYADHSSCDPTRPCIFTLSKWEVRSVDRHPKGIDIGWLRWKDLAAAITQTAGADSCWLDLLSFLDEEGIAWRSLPKDRVDTEACLKVLADVNQQLQHRWPGAEMNFSGPAPMRKQALNTFKDSGRLVAKGGPLTYGLVPRDDGWFWSMSVGSENYQRVLLNGAAIVRQADAVGLSPRWERSALKNAALAVEVPLREYADHEDAVAWFSGVLNELQTADVLRVFLDGLAAKRKSRAQASGPPREEPQQAIGENPGAASSGISEK
jgi:hypothetical protein